MIIKLISLVKLCFSPLLHKGLSDVRPACEYISVNIDRVKKAL